MNLERALEAILFYKSEPTSISWLSKVLETDVSEIKEAAQVLEINLKSRGIRLILSDEEMTLVTSTEMAEIINKIAKQEYQGELGKAGLETLSLILYKNPISRAEIDYVRGVNSSFIVRHLTIRGLIERIKNPNDPRGYVYKPTLKLLAFMGVSDIEDLPQYNDVHTKLGHFLNQNEGPTPTIK